MGSPQGPGAAQCQRGPIPGTRGKLSDQQQEAAWKELCREAEEILKPTLRLAAQIASAHEELRQQSANLMTFTEVRTDPLTGVNNRRGLDDALAGQFAMMNRYGTRFSVAMFDIDHFKQINDQEGHLFGDRTLQRLARMLDECVRETDVVARYGGEEFVVVMPETDVDWRQASFAERLRVRIEKELPLTVSGGVTEALDGDTQDSLLARADAALYQAKTLGRNCIFRHMARGQRTLRGADSTLSRDSECTRIAESRVQLPTALRALLQNAEQSWRHDRQASLQRLADGGDSAAGPCCGFGPHGLPKRFPRDSCRRKLSRHRRGGNGSRSRGVTQGWAARPAARRARFAARRLAPSGPQIRTPSKSTR